MISIETASRIKEALGPASITFQAMTPREIAEDFEAFQNERRYKNTYYDWLSAILATERIHLEKAADADDVVDQMRRRLYAVKLKGDDMKKGNKKDTTKKPAETRERKAPKSKKAADPGTGAKEPAPQATAAKAKQPAAAVTKIDPPKVGDTKLATEADFTNPSHPRLSDYRYYAMIDNKGRIVGRGFLARVDTAPKRSWFALRNDEQTTLWETSKWAIREVTLERYQQLTLEYLKAEGWPEFKAAKAEAA